jgi:hypothetical protein
MDILKAKLRGGLIVKDYVPSFAERPNTYAGATGCACRSVFFFTPTVPGPPDPDPLHLNRFQGEVPCISRMYFVLSCI